MTTTQERDVTRLRITDSQDFLSLIPYLLGYRPDERLVFVLLDGTKIVLTGALPLDTLDSPDQARHGMMSAVERFPGAMVLLTGWSSNPDLAEEALALAEIWVGPEHVLDSISVQPDRWHSRWGEGQWGRTGDLAHTSTVAQAVVAGMVTVPSREDAVAIVAGPGPDREASLEGRLLDAEDALHSLSWPEWEQRASALHASLTCEEAPSEDAGPDALAEIAVLVDDELTRELLWLAMGRRTAKRAELLWGRVVAHTPAQWAVGPLLMLGFASWLSGNGAVLVACIERLLALGERGHQVVMLDTLNREAIPPQSWEQARARKVFGVP